MRGTFPTIEVHEAGSFRRYSRPNEKTLEVIARHHSFDLEKLIKTVEGLSESAYLIRIDAEDFRRKPEEG